MYIYIHYKHQDKRIIFTCFVRNCINKVLRVVVPGTFQRQDMASVQRMGLEVALSALQTILSQEVNIFQMLSHCFMPWLTQERRLNSFWCLTVMSTSSQARCLIISYLSQELWPSISWLLMSLTR